MQTHAFKQLGIKSVIAWKKSMGTHGLKQLVNIKSVSFSKESMGTHGLKQLVGIKSVTVSKESMGTHGLKQLVSNCKITSCSILLGWWKACLLDVPKLVLFLV